jgi:hypothetical protein
MQAIRTSRLRVSVVRRSILADGGWVAERGSALTAEGQRRLDWLLRKLLLAFERV